MYFIIKQFTNLYNLYTYKTLIIYNLKALIFTHTHTHKAYEIEQKRLAPFHRWGNLSSGKLKLHAQGLTASN